MNKRIMQALGLTIGFILILFGVIGAIGNAVRAAKTADQAKVNAQYQRHLEEEHHVWGNWGDPQWCGTGQEFIIWRHCKDCNITQFRSVEKVQ